MALFAKHDLTTQFLRPQSVQQTSPMLRGTPLLSSSSDFDAAISPPIVSAYKLQAIAAPAAAAVPAITFCA